MNRNGILDTESVSTLYNFKLRNERKVWEKNKKKNERKTECVLFFTLSVNTFLFPSNFIFSVKNVVFVSFLHSFVRLLVDLWCNASHQQFDSYVYIIRKTNELQGVLLRTHTPIHLQLGCSIFYGGAISYIFSGADHESAKNKINLDLTTVRSRRLLLQHFATP